MVSVSFSDENSGCAVGINGTILKTIDGGAIWTHVSSSITFNKLNSIFFTDENIGYIVGDEGIILKTINSGTTWTSLSSLSDKDLNSIFFTDVNTGYAAGSNLTILKTVNAGATWFAVSSSPGQSLNSIFFTDASTGYAVGSSGTIMKSVDSGITWTNLSSGIYTDLLAVYFTDSNTGYVAGWYGIILKTNNGGSSWYALSTGTSSFLYSVYFTDVLTGYAVGDGTIIKTSNGGITWTALPSGTFKNLYSVYFPDANTGYVVGGWGDYEGFILRTINGGANWSLFYSGSAADLNAVYFSNADTGYMAGNNGTILKTINGGDSPILIVFPLDTNVSCSAGTIKFEVTSNRNWAVTCDASWCTVTPSGIGNGNIFATCSENYSITTRIANITVSVVGLESLNITLTQSGIQPQLDVMPLNQNVAASPGITTFSVIANSDWTAVSDVSWCTVTNSGSGNDTIYADYKENTSASPRIANITVSFPGFPFPVKYVTVTQSGSNFGEENIMKEYFRIYPNPVNGLVKIVPGQIINKPMEIILYGLDGKESFKKQFRCEKEYEIDLSNVTQGCYCLILKSGDQILARKLVIVN